MLELKNKTMKRHCGCCNESDFDDLRQNKVDCAILLECGDNILTECKHKILREK